MTAFESVVEQEAIEQLQDQGYSYAPGAELGDERGRSTEVFLRDRFRRTASPVRPSIWKTARPRRFLATTWTSTP